MPDTCPECGAPVPAGGACQANFHALLALEWEVPGGPPRVAHFYAVATHVIQHPGSKGYTREALEQLRGAVRDVLAGRASIADALRRARLHAAAAGRITRREGETAPQHAVKSWPVVVTDVLAGGVDGYAERVEHWARTTIQALDSR